MLASRFHLFTGYFTAVLRIISEVWLRSPCFSDDVWMTIPKLYSWWKSWRRTAFQHKHSYPISRLEEHGITNQSRKCDYVFFLSPGIWTSCRQVEQMRSVLISDGHVFGILDHEDGPIAMIKPPARLEKKQRWDMLKQIPTVGHLHVFTNQWI